MMERPQCMVCYKNGGNTLGLESKETRKMKISYLILAVEKDNRRRSVWSTGNGDRGRCNRRCLLKLGKWLGVGSRKESKSHPSRTLARGTSSFQRGDLCVGGWDKGMECKRETVEDNSCYLLSTGNPDHRKYMLHYTYLCLILSIFKFLDLTNILIYFSHWNIDIFLKIRPYLRIFVRINLHRYYGFDLNLAFTANVKCFYIVKLQS